MLQRSPTISCDSDGPRWFLINVGLVFWHNLAGDAGVTVAIGQGIQLTGVVIALIASGFAVRAGYRETK